MRGAKIGKGLKIYGSFRVQGGYKRLVIGDNCTINHGVFLGTRGGLTLGNNVRVSPYAVILSSGLHVDKDQRMHFEKETVIEDNVWIASGVIVNAGMRIGANSVVGSGSVITKDVPMNVLVAGVPAKVIREI